LCLYALLIAILLLGKGGETKAAHDGAAGAGAPPTAAPAHGAGG
jgi:hypothetical protein